MVDAPGVPGPAVDACIHHANGGVEGETLVGGWVATNDVGPGYEGSEHDHAHDGDEREGAWFVAEEPGRAGGDFAPEFIGCGEETEGEDEHCEAVEGEAEGHVPFHFAYGNEHGLDEEECEPEGED